MFIDSEGFGDKDGEEDIKSLKLKDLLIKIKQINLILFVLKSNDYWYTFLTKEMILIYKEMFGDSFFLNTAFVITHFSY